MTSANIELSSDEALVLYSWISRFNKRVSTDFEDQLEQRVLWNIEALLEESLSEPLLEDYDSLRLKLGTVSGTPAHSCPFCDLVFQSGIGNPSIEKATFRR